MIFIVATVRSEIFIHPKQMYKVVTNYISARGAVVVQQEPNQPVFFYEKYTLQLSRRKPVLIYDVLNVRITSFVLMNSLRKTIFDSQEPHANKKSLKFVSYPHCPLFLHRQVHQEFSADDRLTLGFSCFIHWFCLPQVSPNLPTARKNNMRKGKVRVLQPCFDARQIRISSFQFAA